MRRRYLRWLWILALVAGAGIPAARILQAEDLPKQGTFKGYYLVTRWGEKVFVSGVSTFFVSDNAARSIEHLIGQPITIQVPKLEQQTNPGAGMIMEIAKAAAETPTANLALTTKQVVIRRSPPPLENTFEITLENRSQAAVHVPVRNIRIVIATNKPQEPKVWRDPEGRAFWYHAAGMERGAQALRFAYHTESPGWTGQQIIAGGKGITWVTTPGDESPILSFAPGAQFIGLATIKTPLPAGPYEAYSYVDGGLPAMSPRIWMDVPVPGLE